MITPTQRTGGFASGERGETWSDVNRPNDMRTTPTQPNDGGPAFPVTASTGDPRDGVYCRDGMSLRDWFAGQEQLGDLDDSRVQLPQEAMETLAGYPMPSGVLEALKWEADWRAALRLIRADAMLAAREAKS